MIKMKRIVSLAILTGILLTLLAFFFNITVSTPKANVVVTGRVVNLCGRSFMNYELTSAPAGVSLAKKAIKVSGLALPAHVPVNLLKENPALNIVAEVRAGVSLPIMPDVPIFPPGEESRLCPIVQKYADGLSNVKTSLMHAHVSKIFQLSVFGNALAVSMKTGYQAAVTTFSQQAAVQEQAFKSAVANQYQSRREDQRSRFKRARAEPVYDFLIVYQNGYGYEVNDLVSFYEQLGVRAHSIELGDLPGYDANDPEPADCSGEFQHECYHFWGDPVPGVSQLAVPSLPGYVARTSAFQAYTKVSFIPGLIRAYIRSLKKTSPLRGVLLIGNPQNIPPYKSEEQAFYYDGFPWSPDKEFPSIKLFTDLYYSLPNVPLAVNGSTMAQQIMAPNIWSCSGPSGVRLDYFCQDNEWRYWPTPPLIAYRNPAHVPQGKVFSLKYGYYDPYWSTIGYSDVVPAGRIVTQDRLFKPHDPVVARYVQKLKRWYRELPGMKNNSINSNAGSTGDAWIYTKEDIDQFQASFGPNSKIYASEFFVPSDKCAGRCVYQNGENIMTQMGQRNMVAFFLNGHGGHIAIQAPYGNGNIASSFLSEGSVNFSDGLRLVLNEYPAVSTIKQAQETRSLIGLIFANSCEPSDYQLANEMHYISKAIYPSSNARSWAEQWIAMDDGGALNTLLNGDAGWGGSDNNFNVAVMQRMKSAWSACGTIGDAYRKAILDGLRDGGMGMIGEWQILNRHLLGSPINHFARLPIHCRVMEDRPDFLEKADVTVSPGIIQTPNLNQTTNLFQKAGKQ